MLMFRQLWFFGAAMLAIGCGGTTRSARGEVHVASSPVTPRRPAIAAVPASSPARPAPTVDDPDERAVAELRRASALFETFVAKAGSEPRFADAVRRSKARMEDIQATLVFLEEGLRERNAR